MRPLPQKLSKHIARFTPAEQADVARAYFFAREKHHGQKRKSGSCYILHPLRIAVRIAKDNYDAATVVAALLHDTLEDTNTTIDQIAKTFSDEVAGLVDGVTKVAAIRAKSKILITSNEKLFLAEVDNYRKLLLAMSSDIRVIIIRLYDRLDNVATLNLIDPVKQGFYARETIEIYAPIAERLGMGMVKGELEDLSFPYAYPEEYQKFIKIARPAYKNPRKIIGEAEPVIANFLKKNDVAIISLNSRLKHFYSLYAKMIHDNKDITKIFDIAATRIIVKSIEDCYKTLGLVHLLFKPLPGRIKDYIAQPKTNGYQSLHTTVKDSEGNVFEIQIRTLEIHEIAEYGLAAHWHYKDTIIKNNLRIAEKNRQQWIDEIQKVRTTTNRIFLKTLKEEFFSRQVYVFTPKGKVIGLPRGSSGIDFAYRIHSDIGNHAIGVKINNRLVPISTSLQNGEIIEILTSNKAYPSQDWLKFVKTSNAIHHIKTAIRNKNFLVLKKEGEKILSEIILQYKLPPLNKSRIEKALASTDLPYHDFDSSLVALAENVIHQRKFAKALYPETDFNSTKKQVKRLAETISLDSLKNIRHVFAGCCLPRQISGLLKSNSHNLIGYVSHDQVIKIHRQDCKRLTNVDKRRLIKLF